jgi:hypothetical protein
MDIVTLGSDRSQSGYADVGSWIWLAIGAAVVLLSQTYDRSWWKGDDDAFGNLFMFVVYAVVWPVPAWRLVRKALHEVLKNQ